MENPESKKVRYSVDGEYYDIPSDQAEDFENDMPQARQVYRVGKDMYAIPLNERAGFTSDNPDAEYWNGGYVNPDYQPESVQQEPKPAKQEPEPAQAVAAPQDSTASQEKAYAPNPMEETPQEKLGFWKYGVQSVKASGGHILKAIGETLGSTMRNIFGPSVKNSKLAREALEEIDRRIEAGEDPFGETKIDYAEYAKLPKDEKWRIGRQLDIELLIASRRGQDGTLESVREQLAKEAGERTDTEKILDRADRIIEDNSKEAKSGFAETVGLLPMIAATGVGVGLSMATKNPKYAQVAGKATFGAFAASSAGAAMDEARKAGATDKQTMTAGLAAAAIMYGIGKIPFNQITGKAAQSAQSNAMRAAMSAMENPAVAESIEKESEKLMKQAADALGLSVEHYAKNILSHVGTSAASFGAMGGMEALVPLIYEDPDKYPVLSSLVGGVAGGVRDGIVMGLLFGGVTSGQEFINRRDSFRKRGGATAAVVDPGKSGGEIYELGEDGRWKPVDGEMPQAGWAEVWGVERPVGEELGESPSQKREADWVHVRMNGKVYRVKPSAIDPSTMMKFEYKGEKTDEQARETFVNEGRELGESAQTPEEINRLQIEGGYAEKKAEAETQIDGGPSAGTQLDIERANAVTDGRRDAIRSGIEQRVGQPFWRDETIQPSDGGEATQTEMVQSVKYSDGREVYIISQDDQGNLATVDADGKIGFLKEEELVLAQENGEATVANLPMDQYLDGKIAEQDAAAEQIRMQQDRADNFAAVRQRIQEEGRINLGTPESEQWASVVDINPAPQGGIVVQVDGEDQPRVVPWSEVAKSFRMPLEPKTNEEIVNARISAEDEVKRFNQAITPGTQLDVPLVGGESSEVVSYQFVRAENVDGEIIIKAYDPVIEQEVDLAPEMITNMDAAMGKVDATPASDVQGNPVPEVSETRIPVQVFDDPVANELGISSDYAYTTKKGQTVVDGSKLWAENPTLWAEWNDRNPNRVIPTKEYLEGKLKDIEKEVKSARTELEDEVKGGQNPDRIEELQENLSKKEARQQEVQSLVTKYDSAEAIMAQAEAEARRQAEQAAAQQEAVPVEETAPVEEQQPVAETPSVQPEGQPLATAPAEPLNPVQEQALETLGEDPHQAVMGVAQTKLDELAKRITPEMGEQERAAVNAERAVVLQEMFDRNGATRTVATTMPGIVEQMRAAGSSEKALSEVQAAVEDCAKYGDVIEGFYDASSDTIFMVSEGLRDAKHANRIHSHEAKHMENRRTRAHEAALSTGVTRDELKNAVHKYKRTSRYDGDSALTLADETLAIASEIAEEEGIDAVPQKLRELGVSNEEFIKFAQNNVDNGRRNGQHRNLAERDALQHTDEEVRGGQDGRDSGAGSGEVEGSGSRPVAGSAQGGRRGESAEPAPAGESGRIADPALGIELSDEVSAEMREKGLTMDGGAVMDEAQAQLKQETGYKTPNERDAEGSPIVGDVNFSITTVPAWAKSYLLNPNARKSVVKVIENLAERMAANDLVYGVVPKGVYKYGQKSSGSKAGPLRTNIEYVVTFDMDTSCPRSLQYLEYVKKIEAQIGRPMTQKECIQLIEMMRVYGQMIPCVYCYCENKRQALKQYYTDFMKARTGVINANTEEEALAAMYGHKTTKDARESKDPKVVLNDAAYKVFLKWRAEKDYNPTIRQLWAQYRNDRNVALTVLDDLLDGGRVSTNQNDEAIAKLLFDELGIKDKDAQGALSDIVSEWKWNRIEDRPHEDFVRVENEDDLVVDERTLSLWREMTLYGKSASQAKNILRYVPYTDELKTLSKKDRDYINGMGGLRMHSSNDFRIDYVLDYFQFMADMAAAKMMGHTYTKSPEFVRIFGGSGYKINMSIAAYEDSHGVRPNPDEGFDWNTARELRERFPNAGTMLMATSDAQVQFALDNDWVDMCIPFHASGLPKAVWYDMRMWTDYSSKQNERFLNGEEMRAELEADGVAVPKDAKAEEVEKMYLGHFNIKVERYKSGKKKGKRIAPHFLPGETVVDGVKIPGHHNNYEEYIRLCREYGVRPRFYGMRVKDNTPEGGGREVDITEHPAYMKLIKETSRTDTPQTPIQFNFDRPSEALGGKTPIDYAMEELESRAMAESQMAGNPVNNIYESYKQDPYGIVDQFINGIIKHSEEIGKELPLDYLTPDSRQWAMTERKALEEAYADFDTIPYHPHEYDAEGNLVMKDEQTDAQKKALAFVNGAQAEEKEPATRFSISEDSQRLFDAAVERFGTTRDLAEAGYVLPDGRMLDFSGRHWVEKGQDDSWLRGMRQVDHRDIADLEYERDGNTPTGIETSMSDFIRRGAIRINDGRGASINLSAKPTQEQESVLTRLIDKNNGDVYLDLGDGEHTDTSTFYDGAKARRVLNDIKRYFDDGVEPDGGIRFSLRGISGATNDEIAMQNLEVAEKMEEEGKDAKAIWAATGWERGADKGWRNEIPDGKPKEISPTKKSFTVGDIIDAPELFSSYPEIKNYKVNVKKLKGRVGAYTPETKEITLDSDYCFKPTLPEDKKDAAREYVMSHNTGDPRKHRALEMEAYKKFGARMLDDYGIETVIHELQHAIQYIENFAKGGNSKGQMQSYLDTVAKENPEVVAFARLFSSTNPAQRLFNFGKEKLTNLIRLAYSNIQNDRFQKDALALADYLDGMDNASFHTFVKDAAKLWAEAKPKGEKMYHSLAGEVESRNVEKRSGMSDEERRATPPSETEDVAREEQILRFSIVTDPLKIAELESGEKELGYRTVTMNADGSFGSPKASKLGKKGEKSVKTSSFKLGQWEQAEENPQLATEDGKINLADIGGVDYNPYIHIRPDAINKQFTSAWRHPEQVYIQTSYPTGELSSGYHADKAKLSVGRHAWTNGDLILSRWDKPERIVPWEEVADAWEQEFKDTGVTFDIVNPGLLPILAERGVEILPPKKAAGKPAMDAYERWKKEQESPRFSVANAHQEIFVANAQRAVENIRQEKATPEQWLKMVEKNGGLKAGEDKWLGLSQWLKDSDKKSLTKQDILDYIEENKIKIEETRYGEEAEKEYDDALMSYQDEYAELVEEGKKMGRNVPSAYAMEEMVERYGERFLEAFERDGETIAPTRVWAGDDSLSSDAMYFLDLRKESETKGINPTRLDYTTNGLENKREIALTVPTIDPWNQGDNIHFGDAGEGRAVAWIRFGDATKEGKRVLFIDEIQSKRHQEGREKGYRMSDKERDEIFGASRKAWRDYQTAREQYNEYLQSVFGEAYDPATGSIQKEQFDIVSPSDEQMEHIAELGNSVKEAKKRWNEANGNAEAFAQGAGTIPAAPFEKNWQELAMKRMLRLAAEEGYDYVAWTKGEQQAERYSLSQMISKIEISKDSRASDLYEVSTWRADNGPLTDASGMYTADRLGETFGKELAVRMVKAADEAAGETATIEGDGLRIGGEGMKGFYDEMLPRFMNKYGKQWGVKVEDITLPGLENGDLSAHAVPVTQEMKDSVMEGQLMFSVSGQEQADRQGLIDAAETGGLKAVLGEENLQDFYREAYASIPQSALRPIVESGLANGGDIMSQLRIYLHDLARNGAENDDTGLLFKLYDDIRFMTANPALTDNDIRWMIWKETADTQPGDLLSMAEDRAMRNRWGVGAEPAEQQFQQAAEETAKEAEARVETAKKELKEEKKATYGPVEAIAKAMAAQKTYDRATVDSIVKAAKDMLKAGNVSALNRREVSRLLTLVSTSAGKSQKSVTRYADQLVEMMLNHIVAEEEAKFMKLVKVKASKVSDSGVEVQGKLDLVGQAIIKAFRDNMNSPVEDIRKRLEEVDERIDSKDDAVREEAVAAYYGLKMALQYKENIAENIEEYKDLKEEFDAAGVKLADVIGRKAYDEFVKQSRDALRKNMMERIDMYRDLGKQLTDVIAGSAEAAAAFRKADQARVEEIHHDANRDMQGTPANEHLRENVWQRFLNSDFVRFFFKSLSTADQMFRLLGRKSVTGEGYLFNRYIKNGFIPASEKASKGIFEATEILDKKVSEVFGKKGMKWSDLYAESRKKGGEVTFLDGGEMKSHEVSVGNLLYIYMANKMADGKMKLRRMGISEEDVERIKESIDPRLIELADWMQNEFYVNLRNKYNEVHERMFGAPMAAIEDYVPLKILANARFEDVDLGAQTQSEMSSTITGSIIKRRRNSLALDILHTDAFSLAIEHIEKMEDWAAFAELRRDLNTLLSYKHFRNQVKNMDTVYGSGDVLWENFAEVCQVLAGKFQPKVRKGSIDTIALNAAKGVTAAKISFRVNTAIKQILSFPAYLSDARVDFLAKSVATPGKSWKWCMENLPLFEKRWKSRIAGDTRLLDTDSDWKIWRDNVVKTASRLGMTPNAFVDATTVAIGAKAMYDTKRARYIKDGYSEEEADQMAKKDAEILYNQTQQSSENAFVSPVQLERTWWSVALTTYRNSSMAYQRQLHDAIRTMAKMLKPGYRHRSIDFMTHQNENNGLEEEEAREAATRQYNRQYFRNLVRVAVFGYGLQFLWKIGNDMWYLLFGDDDDEKDKILKEAALAELAGPVEGLVGGNVISDIRGKRVEKATNEEYGIRTSSFGQSSGLAKLPIESDTENILNRWDNDRPRAVNDIIDLVVQAGIGVNPQTLTDAVVAIIDYENGDLDKSKEVALLMMRILQMPQSTVEKFLIDEIDMEDPDKRKEQTDELAKRYAMYKLLKNTTVANKMYDEGKRDKKLESYEKQFKDAVKKRIAIKETASGEEIPETAEDTYKALEKSMKAFQADLNRAVKDNDTVTEEALKAQPEYQQYLIWKKHQKGINKLNNSIKKTQDENLRQQWEDQLKDSIQVVINELNENK